MLTLPIRDPVLIFAVAMGIFLVVPLLFERLRVPGLIGLIVAGAVVGPTGLHLLERSNTIVLLGTVGLIYLMFLVGLELDLNEFNRHRQHSLTFGLLSFLLPQVVGTTLSLALGYEWRAAALLGAMFASHTLVAYPIASRLGIVKTTAVTTVLGATLLTDMLALLVLAVVTGSAEGGFTLELWATLGISLTIYVTVILAGVPRLGRWFFRRARAEGGTEFIFTLSVLFLFAYLGHVAGVEPIIGALLVGFALNPLIPEQSTLMNRLRFVANTVFVPFFLLSVGMLVDVRAFADREAWIIIAALVGATLASKMAAAKLTQRVFGYDAADGWVMFGLSVSHAAATMAITVVAYEQGLFDETVVNAVVVIILVTCVVGPWVVERFGRELALREEHRPYERSLAPQRILIPLANPATEESLLDLALLVRGADSGEPLYPLMVVPDLEERTEAEVAEAEKVLRHAVLHAAAAEVPVVPLTRVDHNIATGIVRGIAETRSTTVIVGWDGGRSRSAIFGSVLDQVLAQTRQMVIVAKLGQPLNTTRRLVLVLPTAIHRHDGFVAASQAVKTIAHQLGATIVRLEVGGASARVEDVFSHVKPTVPTTTKAVEAWADVLPALHDLARVDDLVVVLSARRGTLPWHPKLERLPAQLAGLHPESFLTIYPPETDASAVELPSVAELPRGLNADRVVPGLPPMPYREALAQILEQNFADDPTRLGAILDSLVLGEEAFSTEIRPGVVVPHARVIGLDEPILFLGTSDAGIDFPHATERARLVFVLLSPADRPREHLQSLAEIARLVSSEERFEELVHWSGARPHAPNEAQAW